MPLELSCTVEGPRSSMPDSTIDPGSWGDVSPPAAFLFVCPLLSKFPGVLMQSKLLIAWLPGELSVILHDVLDGALLCEANI